MNNIFIVPICDSRKTRTALLVEKDIGFHDLEKHAKELAEFFYKDCPSKFSFELRRELNRLYRDDA